MYIIATTAFTGCLEIYVAWHECAASAKEDAAAEGGPFVLHLHLFERRSSSTEGQR